MRRLLVMTKTCPTCRSAKLFMDKKGLEYEAVYAEDQPDVAKHYGVRQAPTLVIDNGAVYQLLPGFSKIVKCVS